MAYAVTFIPMTNRCNGQRTGSCKMQLLRNKMNAGRKNKDMCDSPKIRCLGQLYKARFHCLIFKLSYFYLGILYLRNGNALEFTGNPNIQVYTTPNRQVRYHICFFFLSKKFNISTKVDHFYRNLFLPAHLYTLHIYVYMSNRIVALCVVYILSSMNKLLFFLLNCMTFYF